MLLTPIIRRSIVSPNVADGAEESRELQRERRLIASKYVTRNLLCGGTCP